MDKQTWEFAWFIGRPWLGCGRLVLRLNNATDDYYSLFFLAITPWLAFAVHLPAVTVRSLPFTPGMADYASGPSGPVR